MINEEKCIIYSGTCDKCYDQYEANNIYDDSAILIWDMESDGWIMDFIMSELHKEME